MKINKIEIMRLTVVILFSIGMLFTACQQGGGKQTTPGGYEYELHTSTGGEKPQTGEYVKFDLQVKAGDSTLYDSKLQGPAPGIQIPAEGEPAKSPVPLEDVLKEMAVGDEATLYVSMDTLPQRPPGFDDVEFLEYHIVTTEFVSQEAYEAERAAEQEKMMAEQAAAMKERELAEAKWKPMMEETKKREPQIASKISGLVNDYSGGSLASQLKTTESGLKYIMHEEGSGEQAQPGTNVDVHYYGVLTDGQMFDNSFSRGMPINFKLGTGAVIPGWDEGLALMKKGGKATFFIPYQLAYGEMGRPPSIPGKSELVFYVELL